LAGHASLPWLQRCAYFISVRGEGVAGCDAERHARERQSGLRGDH
jgi:hypothetical protein